MIKSILLLFFLSFSLFASQITVAIASNMTYAFSQIVKEFNNSYNIKIRTIVGSSGKLTAQIINKAPYDLFLSANMKYPNYLYEKNAVVSKPMVYAKGSLVLFTRKNQFLNKNLEILNTKEIKKIALANPKTAPYGKASLEVLKNSNLYEKIKNKLVYAENISQTVVYSINSTDIGFIAKSALYSSKMKKYLKNKNFIDINPKLYTAINQGIVKIKQNENIDKFYDFLFSKKAQKILQDYGYIINE